MALIVNDRVKETSTTTGTGTLNLAGAEQGYESFVSGIGTGNTTYYAIENNSAGEFEVGIGTVTDADGKFSLSVPASTKVLSVSSVNFKAEDFAITNQNTVLATLTSSSTQL